jgi:hypothetical protein
MPDTVLMFALDDGTTKTIEMDATVTESHQATSTVTRHPVEQGSDISDHTRPEPDRLTLDCIISNRPITPEQVQRFDAAGGGRYAEGVYEQLRDFKDRGALCSVVTSLRPYDSMVVSGLPVVRNAREAHVVHFSGLVLERIVIVRNKLTRTVTARDRRAQPKVAKGKQTPKDPARKQSALVKLSESMSNSSNGTIAGLGGSLLSGGQNQSLNP